MTKRSIIGVALLSLITFGIYNIYWMVKTKIEMTSRGADIPTSWLIIIPIVHYYWLWKWSVGVEHVSRGKMSGAVAFILMLLIGWVIGPAIIQLTFNDIADQQPRGQLPMARTV
jgi:Domain of unknown function (DUF4234)